MDIHTKSLTKAGLIKISLPSSDDSKDKIRLYGFSDQMPESIAKIQEIFDLKVKGKIYDGLISEMCQDIPRKPYLFKKGSHFKLISRKEALSLAYSNLGDDYCKLRQYHKATQCYKKNLEFAVKFQDKMGVSRTCCNLGNTYIKLGEVRQAIDFYGQALKIVLELQDKVREGIVCSNLGNAYEFLGELCQAIHYYEKALKIAQELQDKIREDLAYYNLGNAYQKLGENRKAIDFHEKHLKIVLELQDKVEEGRVYNSLGLAYRKLGEIRTAIDFHDKALTIALQLQDKIGAGIAYSNLGLAYDSLGETHKAIDFHNRALEITLERQDKIGESRAYNNLGLAYRKLGKSREAVDCHNKALIIALKLQDKVGEGFAYGNLGLAYWGLGENRQAINFYHKALTIALKLQDKIGEGRAYDNLGLAYRELGEIRTAIDFHGKALTIALKLQDKIGEGRAYGNLGLAYTKLREPSKVIHFHNEQLNIVLELQDKVGEGITYSNLGIAYDSLGKTNEAIHYHDKALKIALESQDKIGESRAYNNLGLAYTKLGESSKAIDFHNKALMIALELQDKVGEGRAYGNLGNDYWKLGELSQAEKYFCESIEIFASLQYDAKQAQWQISIFEELSKPYMGLEQVLLKKEDIQALEISDTRRSRALSSLLFQRGSLKENQDFHLNLLSIQSIQDLAKELGVTFIIYSLNVPTRKSISVHAWIVSSHKEPLQSISLPIPENIFSELDLIFNTFPYQTTKTRPVKGQKQPSQFFDERLSSWYDCLIAPLEEYMPLPSSQKTLTFIPDGFLAHLPFGAFYNRKKDHYLIENYPISVAPSLQVLSLLDQLPKEISTQALLMGNPTTLQEKYNNLEKSEGEVRDIIAPLMQDFDVKLLTQKEATVRNVFKHAPQAKIIHIAAHGVASQKPLDDPYSVFEGFLRLAPDEKYLVGDLHAKDVHLLKLKADLVFMSACHLGRGNLKREGSIGPVWSFLGAGAKSTIASYWPLPEGDMTVKMVDTFYRHYLGIDTPRLSKARALQESVLMAMKTERNKPRQWGAFFLAGLMD